MLTIGRMKIFPKSKIEKEIEKVSDYLGLGLQFASKVRLSLSRVDEEEITACK
jgi:hypothetical protein